MASTNTETKMRTPTQMIQKKVYREDMTFEEEKAFVRLMYRKYEKAGFKPTYEMSAKLPENEMKYNGQPFKVVKRCFAASFTFCSSSFVSFLPFINKS